MFSGIIEAKAQVVEFSPSGDNFCLRIERPVSFDDISLGDSIATDGVCLTVEKLSPQEIQFSVGPETLKVTGWHSRLAQGRTVNLERSLRLGDRIHGHLVTGHVSCVGKILKIQKLEGALILKAALPKEVLRFVWSKGSLTLNGVSLTVNGLDGESAEFCLIPETLERTNLSMLKEGDTVNVEPDFFARSLAHFSEQVVNQAKENGILR